MEVLLLVCSYQCINMILNYYIVIFTIKLIYSIQYTILKQNYSNFRFFIRQLSCLIH